MPFFNNREISIICWGTVFLIWILKKTEIRDSLKGAIKLFLSYKILIPYLLAVIYILLGVTLFQSFGIWTRIQLKDTFIWCIFTIIGSISELTNIKDEKVYFKKALYKNFKFSLIIEFVTGIYSFNLIGELILVPTVIFVAVTQAFAERDVQYKMVVKFLRNFLIVFGIFLWLYTVYEIRLHVKEFASFDTLRDFALSPLLSIWFIPFIYCLWLYMKYEMYFISMSFKIRDAKLLRYAELQSLLRFNVDVKGVERWKSRLFIGSGGIETKADVVNSIKEIKRLQRVEKNPPKVNYKLGWSPYSAKDFLVAKGIKTQYYTNVYENEWSAASDYIKLDDDFMGNTMTYYIEGNETIAKNLHLVLDVKNPNDETKAIAKFLEYAEVLYVTATAEILPNSIYNAIFKKKNLEVERDKLKLKVKKDDWANQNKYSLLVYFDHK